MARESHVDRVTDGKPHRDTTTDEVGRARVAKVHADAERREVEHAALAPEVGGIAFDMARAHPYGRLTLCPSAILHGPSSRRNAASACRRLSALRSFSTKVPMDLNPSFVGTRTRPRIMRADSYEVCPVRARAAAWRPARRPKNEPSPRLMPLA